jgi:hypothetical protein
MQQNVLVLDIAGTPMRWSTPEGVAGDYACGRVAWELGDTASTVTLRGGVNAASGLPSILQVRSIVAIRGDATRFQAAHPALPERGNALLFRRDRHLCAYCGETFSPKDLTRDHIVPRSKGGADVWTNCVTACLDCNQKKGARRVEDFRPLLYVPYAPCRNEQFILSSRRILADQMDYLAARLPRHSRVVV